MKRWIYILPVAGFAVLAFFLFRSLWDPAPRLIPSALINKPAPNQVLPRLDAQSDTFTHADLTAGHVSVVNVFASWCVACREEHPLFMQLKAGGGVPMGISNRDGYASVS